MLTNKVKRIPNVVISRAQRVMRSSALRLRFCLSYLLMLALIGQAMPAPVAKAAGRGSIPRVDLRSRSGVILPQQTGATLTVFGPQRFTRVAGPPTNVINDFSLPADAVAPYTLQLQNGAPDGSSRISSATIRLNGASLFSPSDFNQKVPLLTKAVKLLATNRLEVNLTSAPGSYLTITVTTTRASLVSVNPPRATQGQTLKVTLRGNNTYWVVGQTVASFGPEVSVGGAAFGAPGLVQVTDGSTAVADVIVSPTAALAPRTVSVETPVPGDTRKEIVSLADAFAIAPVSPPGSSSSKVKTIAGVGGTPGFADGSALQARFRNPAGIAAGSDDMIYVADAGNNRIRVVRTQQDASGTSTVSASTLAGSGVAGFADGPASSARFNNPQGVAMDASGGIVVADTGNHRIRRIAADGTVTTLAGNGLAGMQDGPGAQARFNAPGGLASDSLGNIYVADTGNSAVRVINFNGDVRTVAGDGTIGSNDSPGARFDGLIGVALDGQRVYIYLSDTGNHRIRRLDPAGMVFTIAGGKRGFADGSPTQSRFANPSGIAIDGAGQIIITDTTNSLVRMIDPMLAANGSMSAVTTLAGTGDRGLVDGAGNQARFFTPQGVVVTSSSSIIVADTSNHVLRRILVPPVISSIVPQRAPASEIVTINGERFDARGPGFNTVRFKRSAQAGGGQTIASVTAASRTTLTVVVPADASTGPVTVETRGGTATSATDFQVIPPPPAIIDFIPKSGPVGMIVRLTGTALKSDTGDTTVTFAGNGGTRVPALVSLVTQTEVRATVPNGAVSGPIELTNDTGRAVTSGSFIVESHQDFQLTITPSTAMAVQRGSATYIVYVTSTQATFTQLARLTATGLPGGTNAQFDPQQITAGANSTLSLNLSNINLSPGSYPFTIRAAADVDGSELVRTASATINVIAAGQTTLAGRVLSSDNEPIMGATASLDGKTAMTDSAGSFLLIDVAAGNSRPVMIDGRTANAPNRTYPMITEPANVIAGQANVVPFTFYLPPIDIHLEVEVVPGQNTVVPNPRLVGLVMTVPAGANLRHRDNTPVTRVSITPLAPDRIPAPLPPALGTSMVYTSQPGGAIADVAMPVVYPNLAGTNPGTIVDLYAFNHDTVKWYLYGKGKVSQDGRTIAPEIDPTTGRPYGLRDFSWHFPNASPGGNTSECKCPSCCTSKPVDLSTGVKVERATDIAFGGARGSLNLRRTVTSDLAGSCDACPFGRGMKHNYDIRLTGSFQAGGAGRVVMPDQVTGRLFSYAGIGSDGALVFTTTQTIGQLGDVVRRLTGGTLEYRSADGEVMRFDSDGRLVALIDRNGNTTTLSYTGANLTRITDAVGRSMTLDYGGSSHIVKATDPIGRIWQYEYDGGNRLAKVTDPLGHGTRYGYDFLSRFTSLTDPRGEVVKQITYDGSGRVAEQKFADGGKERYSYELSGTTVTSATRMDALDRTENMRINAAGHVTEVKDTLGQSTKVERNLTTNLPTSTTGPNGQTEDKREFDQRGNLTKLTDRLGQTESSEYEPVFNKVTHSTDKLGRSTTYGYDSRGNLTSITNALNQTTTFIYDSFGELTSVTDPLGHTARMEYDANGNVIARIDALGNRSTMEYDGVGRVTAMTDPLGRRTSLTYDTLDRVKTTTDPSGSVTTYAYDENGNLTSLKDALNHTWTSRYDAKNRRISTTDPLGRVMKMQYDLADQLTEVISPSGRTQRYSYDPRGLLTTMTDPLGGVVKFGYDNQKNLVTLTDQRNNTTTYTYDQLYRPTGMRDPLGRSSNIGYDPVGNITTMTDRLGRQTTIAYDPLNRVSRKTFVDAVINYTYDAAGRPTRIDDTQAGSIGWAYDDANRLLSETTPAGVVSYAYNAARQRASMTVAGRTPVTYGYDSAGRLQTIKQGTETFTFAYDELSRRKSLARPNGVTTTYGYDAVNRLARLTHGQNPLVEDFQYSYNDDDEIESITSLSSGQQLPPAKTVTPADAANRVTRFGQSNFTFDAEGQTTSKTDTQGTTSYQWDGRGRLTQATLPNGQTVNYSYDALGRRTSRAAGGVTTTFLNDGADVVLDKGSDGSAIDYLNGLGIDNKLRQASATTGALYFIQDHLGTTTALTDLLGNVVERMQYEAFGESAGSAFTRYGYTGRERDTATGLMYYRARWLDPQQGRFISEDPIGTNGGLNLYAYVGNDPVHKIDPLGLQDAVNFGLDMLMNDAYVAYLILKKTDEEKTKKAVGGSDNFFHCLGACRAMKATDNASAVRLLLEEKERRDFEKFKKGGNRDNKGNIQTDDWMKADCDLDRKANEQGIRCAKEKSCEECCGSLLNNLAPHKRQYMKEYRTKW